MTNSVIFGNQVSQLRGQVLVRCEMIKKLNHIKAMVNAFCVELAKTHQRTELLVEHLGQRRVVSSRGGERSLKMLFIVLQVISDLRAIEDLGRLSSEVANLQNSAAALEAETAGLHTDIETLQREVISLGLGQQ